LPDEADELLKARVQVINLWRPNPRTAAGCAAGDVATLAPWPRRSYCLRLIYPNRRGETYSVAFNPAHRWFYIPEMTADEALLLKCYDSANRRSRAFRTAHRLHRSDNAAGHGAAREHRICGRWCFTAVEPRNRLERELEENALLFAVRKTEWKFFH